MQQIHNTHSLISAPLSLSFAFSSQLSAFHSLSHSHSLSYTITLSFTLIFCVLFFFLLFTLMRGLKSSNKVCLLKNSSYSAFLLLRSFFSFFCQFIFLVLSISHSHSLVIVMYQNKLNILFTSSLNSVKIFHTFR